MNITTRPHQNQRHPEEIDMTAAGAGFVHIRELGLPALADILQMAKDRAALDARDALVEHRAPVGF